MESSPQQVAFVAGPRRHEKIYRIRPIDAAGRAANRECPYTDSSSFGKGGS